MVAWTAIGRFANTQTHTHTHTLSLPLSLSLLHTHRHSQTHTHPVYQGSRPWLQWWAYDDHLIRRFVPTSRQTTSHTQHTATVPLQFNRNKYWSFSLPQCGLFGELVGRKRSIKRLDPVDSYHNSLSDKTESSTSLSRQKMKLKPLSHVLFTQR